ncbi:hypothetical protein FRX31_019250 [Thalictrum thalictroides]|uniref:Uncharacterized protein n=1 Tax=Thalictrum thalictroides TaxID=46969 RepID=A0A7J6W3Q9_THATH|nr:hypothetical protein FRX31_019250 [Thalictrum thalictroides]
MAKIVSIQDSSLILKDFCLRNTTNKSKTKENGHLQIGRCLVMLGSETSMIENDPSKIVCSLTNSDKEQQLEDIGLPPIGR